MKFIYALTFLIVGASFSIPNSLSYLPSTEESMGFVESICSEMAMDGCDKCIGINKHCDAFQVYTDLCRAMPGMAQCERFKEICSMHDDLPFCPSLPDRTMGPIMKMYFHFGYSDYILFKPFVPTDFFTYAFAFMACFSLAVGYEYLLYLNAELAKKWRKVDTRVEALIERDLSATSSSNEEDRGFLSNITPIISANTLSVRASRGAMRVATITYVITY